MTQEPEWARNAIGQGKDDPMATALKKEDPAYADWLRSPYTRRLREHLNEARHRAEDLEVQKRVWTYAFAHALQLQHGLFQSADGAVKLIEGILEALPDWAPQDTPGGHLAHAAAHKIIPELNAIKGALNRMVKLIFTPEGGPEREDESGDGGAQGGGAPPAVAP